MDSNLQDQGWIMEKDVSRSSISKCRACQRHYRREDGETVARTEDERSVSHLVHSRCADCRAATLSRFDVTDVGVTVYQLPIELSPREVHRFMRERPVSADDVLAAHQVVSHQEGDRDFIDLVLDSLP